MKRIVNLQKKRTENSYIKNVNLTHYLRNANKHYNEVPLFTLQTGIRKPESWNVGIKSMGPGNQSWLTDLGQICKGVQAKFQCLSIAAWLHCHPRQIEVSLLPTIKEGSSRKPSPPTWALGEGRLTGVPMFPPRVEMDFVRPGRTTPS